MILSNPPAPPKGLPNQRSKPSAGACFLFIRHTGRPWNGVSANTFYFYFSKRKNLQNNAQTQTQKLEEHQNNTLSEHPRSEATSADIPRETRSERRLV
jgi:hypothetical protein